VPDYDVGITGLDQPPATAPVQTYYPAVAVKNYGIHPAAVTGLLRIYDKATGELLETHDLASAADIPAGETRNVASAQHWVPTEADIGRQFLFIADVTTWRDQYEPNNHLPPVTVTVTVAPPPPPPAVTPHAAQHQSAGADAINVDGLHGELDDPQAAKAHKTSHQLGGSDQLNVTGLSGILADGQPIAEHHKEHEAGGGDELNVDDLHGELYNKQKPKTHDNAAHDPNYSAKPHGNADHDPDMATKTEHDALEQIVDSHVPAAQGVHGLTPNETVASQEYADSAVSNHNLEAIAHEMAANLEKTANKGAANGYAPLDADAKVPPENLPAWCGDVAAMAALTEIGPNWVPLAVKDYDPLTLGIPCHWHCTSLFQLDHTTGTGTMHVAAGFGIMAELSFDFIIDPIQERVQADWDIYLITTPGGTYACAKAMLTHQPDAPGSTPIIDTIASFPLNQVDPAEPLQMVVQAKLDTNTGNPQAVCYGATITQLLLTPYG